MRYDDKYNQPNFERNIKNFQKAYNFLYDEAEEAQKKFDELNNKENSTEEEQGEIKALQNRLEHLDEEMNQIKYDQDNIQWEIDNILQGELDELNKKEILTEKEQEEFKEIKYRIEWLTGN